MCRALAFGTLGFTGIEIMSGIIAILPAAELGTRMGGESPKQFRLLDGVPLLVFTLRRLAACPSITQFLIATRADEVEPLRERLAGENLGRPLQVVAGGESRQESVARALSQVPSDAELI